MNKRLESYKNKIQKEIMYCLNCQPRDDGEFVWVMGEKRDLQDLFDDYNVPEMYRKEITEKLVCKNCGSDISIYDEIGVKTDLEVSFDKKIKKWEKSYKNQFYDFTKFLENYPYLGAKHKMGINIIREINNFPRTKILKKIWFRARRLQNGRKYKKTELLAPNNKKTLIPEGRFNHFGQSHLYLSEREDAAAKEVLKNGEVYVQMQKFIINEAYNILDLRTDWYGEDIGISIIPMGIICCGALTIHVKKELFWKPGYFVTRFIADVAKLNKFNGIIYNRGLYELNNLVIFDKYNIKQRSIGKPYIYEYKDKVFKEKVYDLSKVVF